MKFWLIILRIICGIQLLVAVFKSFSSLADLFTEWEFIYLFQAIAFALIAALPVQFFIIVANNYPDKVIEGKRKKNFNRIFLVNFLLLAFLFGFVFKGFTQDVEISEKTGLIRPSFLLHFYISIGMLVFQFIILFGLFWLRSHIYHNVMENQFDFEAEDEKV
jgi:cytochrome bd-type quinol oxidase subunit 2